MQNLLDILLLFCTYTNGLMAVSSREWKDSIQTKTKNIVFLLENAYLFNYLYYYFIPFEFCEAIIISIFQLYTYFIVNNWCPKNHANLFLCMYENLRLFCCRLYLLFHLKMQKVSWSQQSEILIQVYKCLLNRLSFLCFSRPMKQTTQINLINWFCKLCQCNLDRSFIHLLIFFCDSMKAISHVN